MQRYHFHFKWPDDAVFDEEGIELENFTAAYLHACELVHQVRRRFPAAGSDWWIANQGPASKLHGQRFFLLRLAPGCHRAKTQGAVQQSEKNAVTAENTIAGKAGVFCPCADRP